MFNFCCLDNRINAASVVSKIVSKMKKNIVKYLLISFMLIGVSLSWGVPVFATQSKASLDQKLKQTNNKRYYFQEKKKQADLKLRKERNKLSNKRKYTTVTCGRANRQS